MMLRLSVCQFRLNMSYQQIKHAHSCESYQQATPQKYDQRGHESPSGYVVDRARVNGTTRYSHEAPAELAISSRLFTSGLSDLYHRYFFKKNTPYPSLYIYYNYHIDSEMVMSHFRIPSVMMIISFLFMALSVCAIKGMPMVSCKV